MKLGFFDEFARLFGPDLARAHAVGARTLLVSPTDKRGLFRVELMYFKVAIPRKRSSA